MDQPKTAGNSPNIRFRPKGWKETALIMLVFAITGTTSMRLTRPALTHVLGLEGSWRDGPWSWRAAYCLVTMPVYSTLLISFGTLFGRGAYFRHVALRPYSWLIQRYREVK